MSFLDKFSGSSMIADTKESALRSMTSGIATLKSASSHQSKRKLGGINEGVRLVFDAVAPNQDGHDEYFRTSTANNLSKSIAKFRYLFTFGNNEDATKAFSELPNPFTEVVGDDGKCLTISTADELTTIRSVHGEDVDTLEIDGIKYCVRVVDAKAYCDAFIVAVTKLVDYQYFLKIASADKDDRGFQKLISIQAPPSVS